MSDPLGKASGHTFNRTSTSISDTCWSSLSVTFCHTLKNVKLIGFRRLEERVTHAR